MLDKNALLAQIDPLLSEYMRLKAASKYDDLSDLPPEVAGPLATRIAAAIERIAPPNTRYRADVQTVYDRYPIDHSGRLIPLNSALSALRTDIYNDCMTSLVELVHADIFADFLEMADHLLDQGYKDPAAVLAGSVVEEHLRKLCVRNSIPVEQGGRPKKSDSLNAELASVAVYSKLDQKSVLAWLDLRNKAAHGHYSEYAADQVRLLVQGARDFIARNPA